MRSSIALIFVAMYFVCFPAAVSRAQDNARPTPPEPLDQYLVTLTEYHVAEAIPVEATEADILKIIKSPSSVAYTTVRMTATQNTQNSASFDRPVKLLGKSVGIGTTLSGRFAPHRIGLIGEINYTVSRLKPKKDTNSSGSSKGQLEIASTSTQSTQTFALGEERLLLSTSKRVNSCIVVRIQQLK